MKLNPLVAFKNRIALAGATLSLVCLPVSADTVSGNVFLRGNYVEVGIHPSGSFGTTVNAPAGFHPRPAPGATSGQLGFVADPAKDGWTVGTPNYVGDYFVPGSPEEGWALKWTGSGGASRLFGNFGLVGQVNIPATSLVETSSGTTRSAVWEGTATSGTEALKVTQTVSFNVDDVFFVMHVTLVNTGTVTVNAVKYMRNVDPDLEQPLTGSFTTANYVVNDDLTGQRLVVGKGQTYGAICGLGTNDLRAVVSAEGFGNRDPDGILGSPVTPSIDSPHVADEAIALAYNLGSLAPGQSVSFDYAYILKEADLQVAVGNLAAVTILQPTGTVSGHTVLFQATTNTVATTTQMQFYVNGTLIGADSTPDSGGVFEQSFDSTANANGTLNLKVVASFSNGTSIEKTTTVTVDNSGPPVAFATPTAGTVYSGASIPVQLNVLDEAHPPVRVSFFRETAGAGSVSLGEDTIAPFATSFSVVGLPLGATVIIKAVAADSLNRLTTIQVSGVTGNSPSVTLAPLGLVASSSAIVNGTVNANSFATTAQFEYGPTTSYGSTASVTLSPNNGSTAHNVSAALTGLTPYTLYHYRLTASNTAGTVATVDGTFSTGAGALDLTFNSTGKVTAETGTGDDAARGVAVQADGRIVVAGHAVNGSNGEDFAVRRYLADGSVDSSFGTGGVVFVPVTAGNVTDKAWDLVIQSDGKILVAGFTYVGNNFDFAVVRLNADGSLDGSFGTGGKVFTPVGTDDDVAMAIALQADGKILVAGYDRIVATNSRDFAVVRYTSTGTLDTSFGTGGKVTVNLDGDDLGYSLALQADGKAVIAGETAGAGNYKFGLIRLTTAGALDTTFNGTGKVSTAFAVGSSNTANRLAIQADGKIVAVGSNYDGSNYNFAVARYTIAGGLDSTFGIGGLVVTPVAPGSGVDLAHSLVIQPDGRIVVVGYASNGSNDDFAVVRYTSAGVLDSTFGAGGKVTTPVGSGNDVAYNVCLATDRSILTVGKASNGTDYDFALARYLGDFAPPAPVASTLGDVVTNAAAPDGAGAADGTQFDAIQRSGYLAQNGTLAFLGYLKTGVGGVDATNFMGYWKHDGTSLTRIARQGSNAPETGATAAKFNILPLVPGINDGGQVTLYASLLQSGLSTPVTTADNDTGLWSELGGTGFQILVREDDALPILGGPKVDTFGYGCFATAKTSASTGEAAFVVGMRGSSTESALLRCSVVNSDTTAVGIIAREGLAAPGAGENFGGLNNNVTRSVRMDATGNVVFAAYLPASSRTGIWYQDQATKVVSKAVLTGEAAPGTSGATFQQLDLPNMGGEGTFAFRAVLNATGDNADNSKNDGIWKSVPGVPLVNILRRGDSNTNRAWLFTATYTGTYPGIKAGNIYNGWLTNANHGAWLGWVDLGGNGISPFAYDGNFTTGTDSLGVYTDTSGTMTLLIAAGDAAPGMPVGAKFFLMDHPVCGGAEQVAFIGTVTGGGVTAGTTDKGAWRTAANGGTLSLVLRTGDTVTTSQGTKTIADLDIPGSGYADHLWETPVMDATGRLLLFVAFTDGSTSQIVVP